MKNVLLVMLEFDNWNQARAWSYTGAWAFQDGLEENGHRCTVLPAMWGRAPDAADSFIHHAEKLLAGQTFDEAWVWCVHTQFDARFWQWLARVAPTRIGITMESLGVNAAESAEFPHFAQRQEEVLAQLAHCTHAIVADEADIDLVQQRLGIPASWNVVMVPERFVRFDTAPECPQAAFIGNKYGERRPYLEDPALAELLCRPHLPERGSDLPQRFDALHQEIRRLLLAGQFDHALLQRATLQMKLVREALFRLHLDGIRLGFANINLPSMIKAYAGRVTESMAAATPAVSWLPPDRPACARLFKAGTEIELFSSPAELHALLTHQAPDSAQRNRQVTAARNTLLNRHTTRIRLRQYQNWLDQGIAPDFFSDIGYKPSVEESQYYKHFFAEDPHWSRPTPNGDERARWEKIQAMVGRVREAQGEPLRIVEVGCGRGWLSKLLSEYGAVLGSEPVGDVINHAKGMFPEQEFFTGSAELLQFIGLKEFFDLLVCSEVIEHVPYAYKEGFVAGLAGLVRPGGYLILTTPRADIYPEWSEKYGKPPQPTEDWLTEAQLKALMEGAGCEALELQRAFLMDIYQIWLFQRKAPQDPVIAFPDTLETTLTRMLGDAWQLATGQSGSQAIGDALSCLKDEAVRSKEDLTALVEWATQNAQTPITELKLPEVMQRAFSRLCTAAGKGLDASALHALIPSNTFNQAWPSRVPHMRKLMAESFNGPIQALEIGAWFGRGSTRIWLETLPAGSTLTIIDGWRSYLSAHDLKAGANIYKMMDDLAPAAFASTIRTVYEFERKRPDIQIILIRANAGVVLPKFSPKQFDFIYVDGSHYYKEAREDISLCKGLLKDGGIMCGDDLELSPTPELLAIAAAHYDKDFITLPDGRGFHPGVMRAVHEEAPGFTMREGFWWSRLPDCV